MFQDPLRGTAPHMTIEENLALAFLRASGHTSAFSRINKRTGSCLPKSSPRWVWGLRTA